MVLPAECEIDHGIGAGVKGDFSLRQRARHVGDGHGARHGQRRDRLSQSLDDAVLMSDVLSVLIVDKRLELADAGRKGIRLLPEFVPLL